MDTDKLATVLAAMLTDATLPMNQLKRPAKRTCFICGGTWVSRVSMLCEDGMCSDACRAESAKRTEEMRLILAEMQARARA